MDKLRSVFVGWTWQECDDGTVEAGYQGCWIYEKRDMAVTVGVPSSEFLGRCVVVANTLARKSTTEPLLFCCACWLANRAIHSESYPPYCGTHMELAIDITTTQENFVWYQTALDGLLPEIKQMVLQLICGLI